jgi:phage terminase small subunit
MEKILSQNDLNPPRPLTAAAREIFDRQHGARIFTEGRWKAIDVDLLAAYSECVVIYLECQNAVETQGALVMGRNSGELVRNAALTPLNQSREAVLKLAKAVPLVDHRAAGKQADWDKFIKEMSS